MAVLSEMVVKLEAKVQDEEYPVTNSQYEDELTMALIHLGYTESDLPRELEALALMMAQVNLYYDLAGKHAKHHRVRVEGDMEIHSQQVAEAYLKQAMALEQRLDKLLASKIDTLENIEATRWRVSDNMNVPHSNGGVY